MATDVKLSSEFTIIYGGEVIAYCTDFTLERAKEVVDITKLGDTWKNKKTVIKDFSVSFNGMVTRGDTITSSLWNETTAYSAGAFVVIAGNAYEAQGSTTGDNPTTDDGTNWVEVSNYAAGTTYAAGDMVYLQTVDDEKRIYVSLVGSNIGNSPDTSSSQWERLETNYETLLNELKHNDTEVKVTIKPVGSGETYYAGNGVLTSLSASIGVSDKMTFSGSLEGTGALTSSTSAPSEVFTTEYQAVYDSFTTPPSSSIATAQNTLVAALKTAGVWSKMDLFFVFAQSTNGGGEALKNWVNPGTYDASLVADPPFTALEGFTGDGSTHRITTGYRPSAEYTNFLQDSASMGAYSRSASGAGCLMGNDTTTEIFPLNGGSQFIYAINGPAVIQTVADAYGLLVVSRVDSANVYGYKHGTQYSGASISEAPDSNYMTGLSRALSQWGAFQISFMFVGGGLTQANVTALTNAFEAYMDSNGKGVVS